MNQFFLSLSLVALLVAGCGHTPTGTAVSEEVTPTSMTLCGVCGQLKDSEACCAEGAEACESCSLHKGSPGCCKMIQGQDVALCAACGEVEDSEACCTKGAEVCDCGFHKGSPACCTLEKPEGEEGKASPDSEE